MSSFISSAAFIIFSYIIVVIVKFVVAKWLIHIVARLPLLSYVAKRFCEEVD